MKLLKLEQNSPEWEEYRRSHIGASDIGILMEGSDREVYELMQIKRGLTTKYVTDAMKRGSNMEAEALHWLLGHSNHKKICGLHDKHSWLMASFDYIDLEKGEMEEIKCPKVVLDMPSEHKDYKKWWWQIQTQIAVSGLSQGGLTVYSSVKQAREKIMRDVDAIAALLKRGEEFYQQMINFVDLQPPSELPTKEDEETVSWAAYAKEVNDKKKEFEELWGVVRDEGIAIAGDEPFICNGVKVVKIASKESYDYEKACKDHKIDLAPYLKVPKSPFTWRVTAP